MLGVDICDKASSQTGEAYFLKSMRNDCRSRTIEINFHVLADCYCRIII